MSLEQQYQQQQQQLPQKQVNDNILQSQNSQNGEQTILKSRFKELILEIPENYYQDDNLGISPQITECYDKNRIVGEDDQQFVEDNTCPICLNLIRDACQCQLGCSGIFGYNCIQHNAISSCPFCRKTFDKQKGLYRNSAISSLIESGPVSLKCYYHQEGCKEILPYNHIKVQEHETQCPFQLVNCKQSKSGCTWKGQKLKYKQHEQTCVYKEYLCKFCFEQKELNPVYPQKDLDSHFENCENNNTNLLLKEINEQIKKSQKQQQQKDPILQLLQKIEKKINEQKNKIQFLNEKQQQFIKYAKILEKNPEDARDKEFLLNDFNKGIINFNSLENLKKTIDSLDKKYIKGVRWNENNLQCYQFSFKSEQNFESTIQFIQDLAEQGDKYSQYSLARLYIFGDKDIQRNVDKSLVWVNKSIEQNCAEGKYLLGRIQHNSTDRQVQDFEQLLELVNSASQLGNPEAKNFLGFVYGKGECMVQNQKKALQFYKKAAAQGNFAALLNLGSYYEGGYGGLDVDPEKSFYYFEKSAKKGYVNAMVKVVQLLKAGKGVPMDEMKAYRWEQKIEYHTQYYTHSIQWQQQKQMEQQQQQQQQDEDNEQQDQ